MRLRCRTPTGIHTVSNPALTANSTLAELKAVIAESTGIPAAIQGLKVGFPPKLVTADDTSTLASCNIRDGDQIIVEQASASATSSATPSTAPAQSTTSAALPPRQPAAAPSLHQQSSGSGAGAGAGGDHIPLDDGLLVVREMKDDNSCLFRSIGYVLEKSKDEPRKFREVIADAIRNDPFTYNEAILGKTPEAYIQWILQPNSWGGAIELSIFSERFQVGEGKYPRRVLVLYSGIHYDAIALSPIAGAPEDFDQTTFDLSGPGAGLEDKVVVAATQLAGIWKKKRKFTDLATFTLRCGVCKKGLVGQKEAQQHAMDTGHTQFTEY
ncbi:hypothetical protein HK102_004504 [Quaeritorhiza haematococci]|nr:hypothetical protein HK102_004504 [Quaeritorhiza haematococci]